jgi:hypothetical protein
LCCAVLSLRARQVPRYRQYTSWSELKRAAQLEADVAGAIRIVERYLHCKPQVVQGILDARVSVIVITVTMSAGVLALQVSAPRCEIERRS